MKMTRFTLLLAMLLLASLSSPMRLMAAEGDHPLVGDALTPPPQRPAVASAGDFKPSLFQPSAFLAGRVAVQLVFVESDGSKEPSTTNWTDSQVTLARNQVATALEWWRTQLPNARIDFTLTSRIVASGYEPIEHGLSSEGLWIGDAYRNMGFSAANYFEQAYSSDDSLRRAQQADWATTIFIANSAGKSTGRFADGYFAYAYVGGPFMVITSDAGPYGASQLTPVIAHEFGHIFGALDQYAAAATPCTQQSGYLAVPTTNSQANNCGTRFVCIMLEPLVAYTQGAIDSSALGQVGYRDSDGDGTPDPLDTQPTIDVIVKQSGSGRPTITASAADQPFPSPAGQPVTINDVTQIEYRADGGPWIGLPPADGIYDSSIEAANAVLPLYDGQHTVEFRATNSVGAASSVTRSSINISGVGPAPLYTADVPQIANTDTISVGLSAPASSMVQISEEPFFGNASWTAVAPAQLWRFDHTDGRRTLYIRFRDSAGLESPPLARTILLDRVAPTGRILLRDNPAPELEIQAQDALSGVAEMQIISGGGAGEWRAYQSSLPLTPAPTSSERIQIRLRDGAGNISQLLSVSSSVYLPIIIR
jgi:hypothetical protein